MIEFLNKNSGSRGQIILLFIETVFITLIWLPNLFFLHHFGPLLSNEKTLQSNLLLKTTAFIDTAKYYACAQIAHSNPKAIWDQSALQKWFESYLKVQQPLNPTIVNQLSYSPYTPQSIAMFMPLTVLPLNLVIIIVELAKLLIMIISITPLIKKSFDLNTFQIILWWLIAMSSLPTTINFYFGQADGLLAGLAAIFILNWQNKNSIGAALSLALTLAIKPQRALVMLIMSLAGKKYRLLLWTLLISAIFLSIAICTLGLDTVMAYPAKLNAIHQSIDSHKLPDAAAGTVSILGLIATIFGQQTAHLTSLPFTIFFLVCSYIIWRKAIRSGQHTYPYAYACTVLLSFLCTAYQHTYSLILLAVV